MDEASGVRSRRTRVPTCDPGDEPHEHDRRLTVDAPREPSCAGELGRRRGEEREERTVDVVDLEVTQLVHGVDGRRP